MSSFLSNAVVLVVTWTQHAKPLTAVWSGRAWRGETGLLWRQKALKRNDFCKTEEGKSTRNRFSWEPNRDNKSFRNIFFCNLEKDSSVSSSRVQTLGRSSLPWLILRSHFTTQTFITAEQEIHRSCMEMTWTISCVCLIRFGSGEALVHDLWVIVWNVTFSQSYKWKEFSYRLKKEKFSPLNIIWRERGKKHTNIYIQSVQV